MQFKLYKIKNGDSKYVTRDENGRCIAFGDTIRETIRATKRELGYSEKLIATYEIEK